MILSSLGGMAVALSIAGFYIKRTVLMIGAAFCWLVLAADAYIVSAGDMTTAAYWVFWFGIAMAIAMALEAVITQRAAKEIKEEESAVDNLSRENEHPADKLRRKHGMKPLKNRREI